MNTLILSLNSRLFLAQVAALQVFLALRNGSVASFNDGYKNYSLTRIPALLHRR
jgi:hypothetical protein